MSCLNLRDLYGDRYKVAIEENLPSKDPWLLVLLCESGHICPWGPNLLAACTSSRGSIAKRLTALPIATVEQNGSDGINVSFHVDHFDKIAAIMKPRRRRRMSEAQRLVAAERLREYQFKPAAQPPHSTLESRVDPQRVSKHQEALSNGF